MTGKTTLTKNLSQTFKTMYLSCSDIMKAYELKTKQDIVDKVNECIGDSTSYILDNYPLSIQCVKNAVELDKVIYLKTDLLTCSNKMSESLDFDQIERRMKFFINHVEPLLAYYTRANKLVEIRMQNTEVQTFTRVILKLKEIEELKRYLDSVVSIS